MTQFTLTLTETELAVVQALDPKKSVAEILTIHVQTWLAPLVAKAQREDVSRLTDAYTRATPELQLEAQRVLGVSVSTEKVIDALG